MPLGTCCTPCATVETVTVPGLEGDPGTNGTAGSDGLNSYTLTTSDTTVPADEATVTVDVGASAWMVVGQKVVMAGPAHFEVVSKPTTTSVTLKFKDYEGDVAVGTVMASGAQVGPSGTEPDISGKAEAGVNTDITELQGLTTPLSTGQGGTGSTGVDAAARTLTARYRLLASKIGANMNLINSDQAFTGLPSKYIVRKIICTNASANLAAADGGIYTGANKTGTAVVAAAQTYTTCSASTKFQDLTIAVTADVLTAASLYLNLTGDNGGVAATADLYIFGEDLS